MKSLYLFIIIYLGLCLAGCATTSNPTYSTNTAKKTSVASNQPKRITPITKNPFTIAMYANGQKPINSYKILGTESISKFNGSGIKRQAASINDAMRDLAASMGGDAVINIAHDDKTVTGTVITYQDNPQQKTTA